MRAERLTLALDSGALSLPETGTILVLRPRAGDDLSDLPRDRLRPVTGFRPDFEAFERQGYAVSAEVEAGHAGAIICLPRARDMARALIAQASGAVAPGGRVIVDGQKTDGIESLWRDLRDAGAAPSAPLSKAHGKIFDFAAGADLADWVAKDRDIGGFITRPGVFSADAPDRASVLLAEALPEKLHPRVADLGAGWGYLARAALAREGVEELHLIEAEAEALACARLNVTDPRARFHWADATRFKAAQPFHTVICNPPFHSGRDADPSLGIGFIRAAQAMLGTSGVLWLVWNRHLPYEQALATSFKEVEDIGNDRAFRVTRAARPVQLRR